MQKDVRVNNHKKPDGRVNNTVRFPLLKYQVLPGALLYAFVQDEVKKRTYIDEDGKKIIPSKSEVVTDMIRFYKEHKNDNNK